MAEKHFRVYGNKAVDGSCESCQRILLFYETLKGRYMPVHKDAVPVEKDESGPRPVWTFKGTDSHFAVCPDAPHYRK